MIYRILAGLIPTLVGWGVFSGAIPIASIFAAHSGLSRDVPASVAAVSDAVSDLNTDFLMHGAGVEPSVAAAVPRIARVQTPDGWTWQILADDKVLFELVATLTPTDGGAGTHVETSVRSFKAPASLSPVWGAAASAQLAPAFAGGIEAELNPLLPPGERLSAEALRKKRLHSAAMISTAQAVSNPMAIALQGQKLTEEIRSSEAEFRVAEKVRAEARAARQGVSFEPGKPMVDPSH